MWKMRNGAKQYENKWEKCGKNEKKCGKNGKKCEKIRKMQKGANYYPFQKIGPYKVLANSAYLTREGPFLTLPKRLCANGRMFETHPSGLLERRSPLMIY